MTEQLRTLSGIVRDLKMLAKNQKPKGNGDKNKARVKRYNCGKKGDYARGCPEPSKVPFRTKHIVFPCICC